MAFQIQKVAEPWSFVEWSNPVFFKILKCTHTAISSNCPNTVTYSGHLASKPNSKLVRIFGTATSPPLPAVPKWELLWRNSEPFLFVTQQKPGTRTKKQLSKIAQRAHNRCYISSKGAVLPGCNDAEMRPPPTRYMHASTLLARCRTRDFCSLSFSDFCSIILSCVFSRRLLRFWSIYVMLHKPTLDLFFVLLFFDFPLFGTTVLKRPCCMTTVLKLATVSKANNFLGLKIVEKPPHRQEALPVRQLKRQFVSPDHLLVGLFICPPTRPLDSSHSNKNFCFIVGLDFIILWALFFTSRNLITHSLIR